MQSLIAKKIDDSIKQMNKYIPGARKEEIREKYDVEQVIKLSSNENPLSCASPVRNVLEDLTVDPARYPDGSHRKLREALADFYNVEFKQIIAGNGSDEIIDLAVELMAAPGDEVIMAAETFSKYKMACQSRRVKPVEIPLDKNYRHDLEAMARAVNDRTRVIFICDPNNPTGTILKSSQLREFLRKIPRDILVVIDQAYCEYVTAEDYFSDLSALKDHKNLIFTRTFSKIYGLAGLRVGYGLGSREIIEFMQRIRNPFNVNSVALEASLNALRCQEHVRSCKRMNAEQRKFFENKFEEINVEYIPGQANFIMIKCRVPAENAFEHFARRGIIVRTGTSFGFEKWIRFTIPPADYRDHLSTVCEKLKKKGVI